MKGRLAGRTALVTGAGSGIGRAVALAFAREGARVAACGRDLKKLEPLASDGVFVRACDVGDPKAVEAFVAAAVKELGRVDYLINNAGVLGPKGPLVQATPAQWAQTMRINADGPFLVTREVLRACAPLCVVGLSSGQGRKGTAGWGPYAASKYALEGMTSVWADEHKDSETRFFTFSPGPTATAMRAAAAPDEDPKTVKTPETVAERLIDVVLDRSLKTGTPLRLDPKGKLEC